MQDKDNVVQLFPTEMEQFKAAAERTYRDLTPSKRAKALLLTIESNADWIRVALDEIRAAKDELEQVMNELTPRERKKVIAGASKDCAWALCMLHASDKIDSHAYELALGGLASVS